MTLAGRPFKLAVSEYDLLSTLAANAGRVSTHDELLRRVWWSRNKGDTRVVHAFVRRLHRKLGDDAHSPRYPSRASAAACPGPTAAEALPLR